MNRMNLMSQLFGQVQDAITVISLAVGVPVAAGVAILAAAILLLPGKLEVSHVERRAQPGPYRACASAAAWTMASSPVVSSE